jgi:hypothetical protein
VTVGERSVDARSIFSRRVTPAATTYPTTPANSTVVSATNPQLPKLGRDSIVDDLGGVGESHRTRIRLPLNTGTVT